MPTTTTNRGADLKITVLTMEFAPVTPASRVSLVSLNELLEGISTVLYDFDWLGQRPFRQTHLAYVISLEMHSPLTINLGLGEMAKEAVKGAVDLIKAFMFYKQERDFRAAQAADAWEGVYAKRLANIRTAIEIATSADAQPDEPQIYDAQIARLLDAAFKMKHSELRLTHIEVREE